jgi:hypothetical protein
MKKKKKKKKKYRNYEIETGTYFFSLKVDFEVIRRKIKTIFRTVVISRIRFSPTLRKKFRTNFDHEAKQYFKNQTDSM